LEEAVNIVEWTNQTQAEVNSLKSKLNKFNNAIVVGVPPAPWCKKSEKTEDMRKKINSALRKIARDNMKIKYVDIEQEDEDDESNWEDERHMTEKFTAYVMGKVSEKMVEITNEQFHIKNTPMTSRRKHSQVRNTYKLGCGICTKTGHAEEKCPGFHTKKRTTCSGSEIPNGKKNSAE
jgi:hypothetical protein